MLRGSAKRTAFNEREGVPTPFTILISPTMRCNLTCEGCFAGEYSRDSDMDIATLQSIVDQANEMGVYLITILGGEPFFREDLLDFYAANPDVYFQVYTNGTLLDEPTLDHLAALGNIAPMLSIEGDRELTDARRGPGIFDQIMNDHGRPARARHGLRLLGDRHAPQLADAGQRRVHRPHGRQGRDARWNFLYMPIGADPDMSLMLTPSERNEFRAGIDRVRNTKALFPVDFWGDAPYVKGCIAGKHYIHINNEGWVEPCIFTHFATDNVHDVSLKEAFSSPFFQEIRRRQPFNHNLLMPCMLIDNPHHSREIIAKTGAHPTHPGAETLITQLQADLDDYAAEVDRVYQPVWSCMTQAKDDARAEVIAVPAPCARRPGDG